MRSMVRKDRTFSLAASTSETIRPCFAAPVEYLERGQGHPAGVFLEPEPRMQCHAKPGINGKFSGFAGNFR
jgi:hypothetical protein